MTRDDKDIEIGQVFEQSQHNAQQIVEMRGEMRDLRRDLTGAIQELGNQMQRATAPNFGTMWAGAGVLVAFIGLVGAVVSFGFQREINRHDESIRDLDTKLQREQNLLIAEVKTSVANVDQSSRERREASSREADAIGLRIAKIEVWDQNQIAEELKELRELRQRRRD